MQHSFSLGYVLLAAAACAAKRCLYKGDNTLYLNGLFCMNMFRQIDINMHECYN